MSLLVLHFSHGTQKIQTSRMNWTQHYINQGVQVRVPSLLSVSSLQTKNMTRLLLITSISLLCLVFVQTQSSSDLSGQHAENKKKMFLFISETVTLWIPENVLSEPSFPSWLLWDAPCLPSSSAVVPDDPVIWVSKTWLFLQHSLPALMTDAVQRLSAKRCDA